MSYTAQPVEVDVITDDWLAKTGNKLGYWSARSKVAHLFRPNIFDGSDNALCGRVGGYFGVEALGTGTQDEYDRARALPLCPRCADRAGVVLDGAK